MNLSKTGNCIIISLKDLIHTIPKILTPVALLAALTSSDSYASDVVMDCEGMLYKYEDNFFQSDAIKVRSKGKWQDWCDGDMEIVDNSASCFSKNTEIRSFEVPDPNAPYPYPEYDHIKSFVDAYCKCGSIEGSAQCLEKNKIDKYGPILAEIALDHHGFEVEFDFLQSDICPNVRENSSTELVELMRDHPEKLFSRKSLGVTILVKREVKHVRHIDFVGLMTERALETISEPIQRADYNQSRNCKIVED